MARVTEREKDAVLQDSVADALRSLERSVSKLGRVAKGREREEPEKDSEDASSWHDCEE